MDIKRNIKYIVIDLDGTLLNDKHKLSERNKSAIKKAIEQGVKVILATGKTRTGAEPVIKELNLDTPGVFVQGLLTCNADGTVRQDIKLDPVTARRAIQFAESQGFEVVAYNGNRLVCKALEGALRPVLAETRQRGYALEDGEVTPGFASVAAAVVDHTGHPAAGVAVTYPVDDPPDLPATITAVRRTAERLSARIGARIGTVAGQAPAPRRDQSS